MFFHVHVFVSLIEVPRSHRGCCMSYLFVSLFEPHFEPQRVRHFRLCGSLVPAYPFRFGHFPDPNEMRCSDMEKRSLALFCAKDSDCLPYKQRTDGMLLFCLHTPLAVRHRVLAFL